MYSDDAGRTSRDLIAISSLTPHVFHHSAIFPAFSSSRLSRFSRSIGLACMDTWAEAPRVLQLSRARVDKLARARARSQPRLTDSSAARWYLAMTHAHACACSLSALPQRPPLPPLANRSKTDSERFARVSSLSGKRVYASSHATGET